MGENTKLNFVVQIIIPKSSSWRELHLARNFRSQGFRIFQRSVRPSVGPKYAVNCANAPQELFAFIPFPFFYSFRSPVHQRKIFIVQSIQTIRRFSNVQHRHFFTRFIKNIWINPKKRLFTERLEFVKS